MNAVLEILLRNQKTSARKTGATSNLISMIREGISADTLRTLADATRLSQAELSTTLKIPQRTLARRKKEGTLNSDESAKVIRLARAISRASDVFEDMDKAIDWLKHPNRALSGAAPIGLLDTDIGFETVDDLLGRIEHGVFS